MKHLTIALLAAVLALPAAAAEPLNKLNLCSRTRQTVVNETDKQVTDAAQAGDIAKVRAALKDKVDPNGTTYEGFSLLHIAITSRHPEIVGLLLKAGADPNQPFQGSSPLSLARTSGNDEKGKTIQGLLKAGARLSDFDEAFSTVVQFRAGSMANGLIDAMTKGDMEKLALYVRATYDINAPLSDGVSALHVAAIQGTPEAVRYLVGCGANVNARTQRGAPVLWFAKDRPDVYALLVELGATQKD